MGPSGSLTDERVLSAGFGIVIQDGGAGGAVTINAGISASPDRVVVTSPISGIFTVGPYWDALNSSWGLTQAPFYDFEVIKPTANVEFVIASSLAGVTSAILDIYGGGMPFGAAAGAGARINLQDAFLSKGVGSGLKICDSGGSGTYLTIGGTPANLGWSGVRTATPLYHWDVCPDGNWAAVVTSAVRNRGAGNNTPVRFLAEVAAASTADVYSQWSIATVSNAVIGLDNGASTGSANAFGAWYSSSVGTSPVWVYTPVNGFFGIFTNNPVYTFDFPITRSGGNVVGAFRNRSNTANSNAYVLAEVEDSASGDPAFQAFIAGTNFYSVWGIDNSDSDKAGWWYNNTGACGTTPITIYDPVNHRIGFLTSTPGYRWHARWDSAGTEVFSIANIVGEMRLDVLGGYVSGIRINPQVAGGDAYLQVAAYSFNNEVVVYSPAAGLEAEIRSSNSLYVRSSAGAGRVIFSSRIAIRYALAVDPTDPPGGDTNLWIFDNGVTRELRIKYNDGATLYSGAVVLT